MVKDIYSFLFYCEGVINQYARQKTLTDALGVSVLKFELSCFRNIELPYRLRMLFMLLWEDNMFLVK